MAIVPNAAATGTGLPYDFLEAVCATPHPTRSLSDFERLHHRDIEAMGDDELARDGRRARMRADLDPDPQRAQWFEERYEAVAAEKRRRRAELIAELHRLEGARQ